MTAVKITPTKLKGIVQVPPSKSLAHRAIICASLAKGVSRIDNIEYSKDIQATIKAMKSLGTKIEEFENYLIIDGTTTFTKQNSEIDCEESGSTLRFMIPISIVEENKVHFVGRGNLGKRPLDTFYEIFERQNIGYMYKKDVLDLYVIGKLKPDHYIIPGNISSQFITGLLFALPLLKGDSIIEITSTLESKGYIDLTLQMLSQYGIKIINNDYKSFVVMGNQEYQAHDYRVEADFSQAAFYLVAGAIGNDVVLTDLNLNSLQGDKATLSILEAMGAKINVVSDGIKVTGENLSATQVDASQCPDVIPVVSVALALAQGKSEVINAKRLRIKECDRIIATSSQLNELGGSVVELSDSMTIRGVSEFVGGNCSSFADHRIAMMLAIATTRCNQSVIIDNMECVEKSYPSFWEDYQSLGGIIDVINMEE
ncbi:3-phosphoshikimate 1-carboxyvinyltransferase [Thomasclavelia cocleata]|uniref:3-phosphoshikimate 1-carboxyvinyltransferase n=1 Tax=Thomasclavelia cocleata TaxID=69824 RepID=A0A1I0EEM8_9FIRM|nr:3-phosphoshikimate 1-carboxyvinyltransferase [Thomasclavelia cocleata]MCR1959365.1 3-phosphoshikimate 1-carboxyvinyltransferase [Thomasclavelia cocleata]NDO42392.1 3-phosphoshikimate 1-carboxyvinyltransferase [Thomasclavelia cocleata]PJN81033.1 3-phosphoshikimate 1-carboxyvinyltransferase [Thomasclavelia cocleata]SET43832.1 3-phosphoshikimate 1-carboxyvinyltransferase [Thomasclavelia cocleata]